MYVRLSANTKAYFSPGNISDRTPSTYLVTRNFKQYRYMNIHTLNKLLYKIDGLLNIVLANYLMKLKFKDFRDKNALECFREARGKEAQTSEYELKIQLKPGH